MKTNKLHFFALSLLCGVIPSEVSAAVQANDTYTYIDENGERVTVTNDFATNPNTYEESYVPGSAVPTGSLDATSLVANASNKVELQWDVNLPAGTYTGGLESFIPDLVEIDADKGTLTTKKELDVEIHLLGSGYGRYECLLEGWAKFSDESSPNSNISKSSRLIDSAEVFKSREGVPANVKLDLAFRGATEVDNRSLFNVELAWSPWLTMGSAEGRVRFLKSGDPAPQFSANWSNMLGAEAFLLPYLSEDANTVYIGPRQVLVLFDFDETQTGQPTNLQDAVVLMTFTEN